MVFGNNTATDISKLSKNTGSREAASGIWKILKYYEPVLLPNTMCSSCYYLFTIEAEKFSVTPKRPFFLRLKKTNIGVYVRKSQFFVKPVQTIQGKQQETVQ